MVWTHRDPTRRFSLEGEMTARLPRSPRMGEEGVVS